MSLARWRELGAAADDPPACGPRGIPACGSNASHSEKGSKTLHQAPSSHPASAPVAANTANLLATQLLELLATLQDLCRRLRHAARLEVGRAVGEALREAALGLICGPSRHGRQPSPNASTDSPWNDPWQNSDADLWHAERAFASKRPVADDTEEAPVVTNSLRPALLAGMAAGRWSYQYTRHLPLALGLGLLVTLAAQGGGPAIQSLVETWSTALDLLRAGSDQQP
jgi:hypothetical protein